MAEIPISFGGGGGSGSDDVTASSAQVLAGYTAITTDSSDEPVEGTIPTKDVAVYNTSTTDQTIASNQYLGGVQTIKAVTTSNIDANNIKKDVVVTVGDSNNSGRIKNVTGTYTTVTGKTAATASQILDGYAAFANGSNQINGTIASRAATSYNPTTYAQTIPKGLYLSGDQTINGDSNLVASNILKGKSIFGVAGNVTKFGNNMVKASTTSGGTFRYSGDNGQETLNYVTATGFGYTPYAFSASKQSSSSNVTCMAENYNVSGHWDFLPNRLTAKWAYSNIVAPVSASGEYWLRFAGYY